MRENLDKKDIIECIICVAEKAMRRVAPFDNVKLCKNFMSWTYMQYVTNNEFDEVLRNKIYSMLCDRLKHHFNMFYFSEKKRFLDVFPEHISTEKCMNDYFYATKKASPCTKFLQCVTKDEVFEGANKIFVENEFIFSKKSPISFVYAVNKDIIARLRMHQKGGFVSCEIYLKSFDVFFDLSCLYGDGQSRFWCFDENYQSIKNLFDIGIPTQIIAIKEIHKIFYS